MKKTKSLGLRRGIQLNCQPLFLILLTVSSWLGSFGLLTPDALLAETFAKTNATTITINDNAAATPYPSTISVSGLTQQVAHVTVTLWGLQHTFCSDISILLVGPQGQAVVLMSQVGDVNSISVDWLTFSDSATIGLPFTAPAWSITNGTYQPTDAAANDQ